MRSLPRLALATSPSGPEPGIASLALLAGLHARRAGKSSTSVPGPVPLPIRSSDPSPASPAATSTPGSCPRPSAPTSSPAAGNATSNLAIVEGTLDQPAAAPDPDFSRLRDYTQRPGSLAPLADLLDLPLVAVVDCRGWTHPHLPCVPPGVDAVILDGLERPDLFNTFRSLTRHLLHIPVLGAIDALPTLRDELAQLPLSLPRARQPARPPRRSSSNTPTPRPSPPSPLAPSNRPRPPSMRTTPRPHPPAAPLIASPTPWTKPSAATTPTPSKPSNSSAQKLVEFSPLRDGTLPAHVDLVMFGCGFPDHYAAESPPTTAFCSNSAGSCRGLRIYAEGGGAAYLGRSMIVDGRPYGGAGILPFDAELRPEPLWPEPVERTIARNSWLGPAGTTLRGYAANRWLRHPAPEPEDCPRRSGPLTPEADLVFRCNAVGSFIRLHLPSLPNVVHAFTGPSRSNTAPRFPSP